jgi:hypothetical protein
MESIPPLPPLQAQEDASTPPQLSEVARGMKVAELRSELKSCRQTICGTKEILVQRLIFCTHLPPSTNVATGNVSNDNQPTVDFHHGVKWRLLDPDPTPLQEPNRIPGLVAPTTHSAGATQEAKKHVTGNHS